MSLPTQLYGSQKKKRTTNAGMCLYYVVTLLLSKRCPHSDPCLDWYLLFLIAIYSFIPYWLLLMY